MVATKPAACVLEGGSRDVCCSSHNIRTKDRVWAVVKQSMGVSIDFRVLSASGPLVTGSIPTLAPPIHDTPEPREPPPGIRPRQSCAWVSSSVQEKERRCRRRGGWMVGARLISCMI
jgi:hypothetical protein